MWFCLYSETINSFKLIFIHYDSAFPPVAKPDLEVVSCENAVLLDPHNNSTTVLRFDAVVVVVIIINIVSELSTSAWALHLDVVCQLRAPLLQMLYVDFWTFVARILPPFRAIPWYEEVLGRLYVRVFSFSLLYLLFFCIYFILACWVYNLLL
jgi:hypothetical protein